MTCGACGVLDHEAVAESVCAACVHGRASGFVRCSINGLPLSANAPCSGKPIAPANRHCPDVGMRVRGDGTVRWWWIRWYGLPLPKRALLTWPLLSYWWNGPMPTKQLPGCGCIVRIKDWWEKFRGRG